MKSFLAITPTIYNRRVFKPRERNFHVFAAFAKFQGKFMSVKMFKIAQLRKLYL